MSDLNFKEELVLDKHNLDLCALEQPELYAKWATEWANAVNKRDRMKDKLSVVRSECDATVREFPARYGWDNPLKTPTEAFINSAVTGHPDMAAANEEYLDAVHEANLLEVAKQAFEQRRRMIEILVQLYVSSYFSGNKDLDKSYAPAVAKESVKQQTEGLNKSPRLARRIAANANPV
jgi:hypothetical protein